ncbi:MAG TPA: hypothetical protein VGL47_06825 [Amycolatopsis sp.]|uniref:Uncharacterized protein n=1 Tax=Amycolatopsis nalaikhensis TaxID=715472 RepID=A0ABY8XW14_9PSEU|nr:hypothetical protein [Amycolatopsis sp. 2-2]WIV59895.1 hypothetical protein QP939_15410 [Amycolatopsis sp. 2-2]
MLPRPADAHPTELRVWPVPGVLAIFRLAKPVVMTAEGDRGYPVLGFDPAANRVVLLAEPRDR